MAFWSGEKLLENVKPQQIIDPYNAKKIDCSAYTLTLGPDFFVSPDYTVAGRDNIKKYLETPAEVQLGGAWRKMAGGELIIPPGQFALLLTEEYVRIPPDVMGFISLKFGVKGPGLINVSGFHVDPGYEGRLVFSVYNGGPSPAHLHRGQDVFLLWLADLDRKSGGRFVKARPDSPQVTIPVDMISKADRPMHSLQSLSNRVEELSTQLTILKAGVAILATAAALTFAAIKLAAPSEPAAAATAPAITAPTPQFPQESAPRPSQIPQGSTPRPPEGQTAETKGKGQ